MQPAAICALPSSAPRSAIPSACPMPDPTPNPPLGALLTETRNPASEGIDQLPTVELLQVINAADAEIAAAVAREIPNIACAVDAIVDRLSAGGRLFYAGAGTSGRLGVLDASECPPTFNVPPDLVQGIIAGGDRALRHAVEGAEDSADLGRDDLKLRGFGAKDLLVGIAASGRTPYVLGGLAFAQSVGATTVGLSCVPGAPVAQSADIAITPAVGPEVITGSTRMRAGTATKLVLNMLTTGAMVRMGLVYSNLMVNVQPTNDKLADRSGRIVGAITGLGAAPAADLLKEAGSVKVAVVMHRLGLPREAAESCLAAHDGNLRRALGETSP